MTQKIPDSLLTYESLDHLVKALHMVQLRSYSALSPDNLHLKLWQSLIGDAAVLADMLVARCGSVYKVRVPVQAYCRVETALYDRYLWACDEQHNEFEFHNMGVLGPVMFFMVDKHNTTWRVSRKLRDFSTQFQYADRCRLLRLFDDLGMLE